MPTTRKKLCSRCHVYLPYDSFFKESKNKTDGLKGSCKECERARKKKVAKEEKKPIMNITKKCRSCQKLLHIDNFYMDRERSDGLRNNCKECEYNTRIKLHPKPEKKIINEGVIEVDKIEYGHGLMNLMKNVAQDGFLCMTINKNFMCTVSHHIDKTTTTKKCPIADLEKTLDSMTISR